MGRLLPVFRCFDNVATASQLHKAILDSFTYLYMIRLLTYREYYLTLFICFIVNFCLFFYVAAFWRNKVEYIILQLNIGLSDGLSGGLSVLMLRLEQHKCASSVVVVKTKVNNSDESSMTYDDFSAQSSYSVKIHPAL